MDQRELSWTWTELVSNPRLLCNILYAHFQARGLVTGAHGSIKSPYDYVEAALLRRTERIRTRGTSGDLDSFTEYRNSACAIEFKIAHKPLEVGQLGVLRFLASRDIPSFAAWHDNSGEIVRAAQIDPVGAVAAQECNSTDFFEHINSLVCA